MRALVAGWMLLCALWGASVCCAAEVPNAEVEAVLAPAWLLRDGKRMPLGLGKELKNRDQIVTGEAARVRLRLADGSVVKLGENARFTLDEMAQRQSSSKLFWAAFDVVQGAFRFTTSLESKFKGQRDVRVKFASITAGVRGTDLWGKTSADRELVALIEGKISIARAGQPTLIMSEPSTVYQVERAAPPLAVTTLPAEVLAKFAAETEMAAGAGEARKGGSWRLYAARTKSQAEALGVYEKLLDAGYDASIRPSVRDGQTEYAVRIVGLLSEADGVAMAVKLRTQLGLQDVSVSLN